MEAEDEDSCLLQNKPGMTGCSLLTVCGLTAHSREKGPKEKCIELEE